MIFLTRISNRFTSKKSCCERLLARSLTSLELTNSQIEDDFTRHAYKESGILYEHHIPTSLLQKGLLAVGSGVAAFFDPTRDDMIAVLGESTGYYALKKIRRLMQLDKEGQKILRERPRITSATINVPALRELPEGTFGKEYTNFLDRNKVTPDSRLPVRFIDDPELAYVMQRYREVHDFNHALLGMPTNIVGEITVKWFEMVQTRLPMCTFGSLLAPLRLKRSQQERLVNTYIPWALYAGYRARFLMNLYVEKYFEEPIDLLRKRLNIVSPPIATKRTKKQM
ncbi:ubiquinone biosynthesis protein COQ4 homolog, mitochondrial-like [Xenia sp. Carnegie-2017]|uniref:ubiquinone biosynthesis protein COQ4 homolog, mitochondrial-like n=1 Tax=Xenia sp. Carnegie-2017 TaxID=2897299 RepID=UPI001F03BB43|nr:ubiquinone biosynthesis protein COQ4 homolog, mitochondrial-like [Xenia sp. Carnegie-2017]